MMSLLIFPRVTRENYTLRFTFEILPATKTFYKQHVFARTAVRSAA